MYKAKANIFCGNVSYEIGKVYETLAKGVDVNDFEVIESKEVKEDKKESPKLTTASTKAKK